MSGLFYSESLKIDEYVNKATSSIFQEVPKIDSVFENKAAENYNNHFDDAVESFTQYIDQARKVQIFLENVIQHSGRNFETRIDEISEILGSKPPCLEKALDTPNV